MRTLSPAGAPGARRQRGAASLVVALVMLFGMTMVAFYANRSLLFEQRTSANQYRATSAFEVAEAGLEWAAARFNELQKIDAACNASTVTTDKTFRDLLLRHSSSVNGFGPQPDARAACRLPGSGSPLCSCPVPPALPDVGTVNEPTFVVQFVAVPGDAESVEVRSKGCTSQGTQCLASSAQGRADAVAEVRVILKLLPALRTLPQAAMSAGGSVSLGSGTVNIINTDALTNGITIDAGGSAAGAADHATTLPGTPAQASVVTHDASLSSLNATDPTGNAFFRGVFGQTMADYRGSRATTTVCDAAFASGQGRQCASDAIGCAGASGCATAVANAVASAKNQLWVDADLQFSNGNVPQSLGTPANPVILATAGNIAFDGDRPLYGLLFGAGPALTIGGAGAADVRGAVMARGDLTGSANMTVLYEPAVLRKLRPATGSLVRVPGSWRDF
jgi:hypothetical protein